MKFTSVAAFLIGAAILFPSMASAAIVLSKMDMYDLRGGTFTEGWEKFIRAARGKKVMVGAIDEADESEGTDIGESEELVIESEPHMEHGPMQPVDEVDHRLVRNPRTGEVINPPEDV